MKSIASGELTERYITIDSISLASQTHFRKWVWLARLR